KTLLNRNIMAPYRFGITVMTKLLLPFLLLSACCARGGEKVLTNPNGHVQIAIPDGWTGESHENDRSLLFFMSGPKTEHGGFQVGLRVYFYDLRANDTLAAF